MEYKIGTCWYRPDCEYPIYIILDKIQSNLYNVMAYRPGISNEVYADELVCDESDFKLLFTDDMICKDLEEAYNRYYNK